MTPETEYAPYYQIISKHLSARGKKPDDFLRNDKFDETNYVVRMLEDVKETLKERTNVEYDVKDLLRVERTASGHSDYQRKFALYCMEIERGISPVLSVSPPLHAFNKNFKP